jgi:hypothetical protein
MKKNILVALEIGVFKDDPRFCMLCPYFDRATALFIKCTLFHVHLKYDGNNKKYLRCDRCYNKEERV